MLCSKWFGSLVWLAKNIVARFCWRSAGFFSASTTGRLFVGVRR